MQDEYQRSNHQNSDGRFGPVKHLELTEPSDGRGHEAKDGGYQRLETARSPGEWLIVCGWWRS